MEIETRIKALAKHLECGIDDLSESTYDEQVIDCGRQEYLVVTDDEANNIWDERLESYIDDCILPDLPDHLQSYFDSERWKVDAQMDGRGHSIASYDSCEYDVEIDDETLYIFRLN